MATTATQRLLNRLSTIEAREATLRATADALFATASIKIGTDRTTVLARHYLAKLDACEATVDAINARYDLALSAASGTYATPLGIGQAVRELERARVMADRAQAYLATTEVRA